MGALKAALTAIFNAHGDNDFGSTSKIPYFNSSNNPYGMATPAKLASVLGVHDGEYKGTNIAIDDSITCGNYGLYAIHTSSGGSWDCIVSVVYQSGNKIKILVQDLEDFYSTDPSVNGVYLSCASSGTLVVTNKHTMVHDFDVKKLV